MHRSMLTRVSHALNRRERKQQFLNKDNRETISAQSHDTRTQVSAPLLCHLLTFQVFFLMFHKADLCSLQNVDGQTRSCRTNCHNKTTHIQEERPSQSEDCAV